MEVRGRAAGEPGEAGGATAGNAAMLSVNFTAGSPSVDMDDGRSGMPKDDLSTGRSAIESPGAPGNIIGAIGGGGGNGAAIAEGTLSAGNPVTDAAPSGAATGTGGGGGGAAMPER